MDLQRLKSFIAIAEKGSITAASKSMYISPVSLREQLIRLESELGFEVFTRSPHGVALTDAGKELYDWLEKLLPDMDTLLKNCRKIAGKAEQELTVALYPPYTFLRYCNDYNALHPETTFRYLNSDYSRDIRAASYMQNNRIDMMQESYSPVFESDNLHFFPFRSEQYCCCCTPSHPLAKRKTLTLKDLANQNTYCCLSAGLDSVLMLKQMEQYAASAEAINYDDMRVMQICSEGKIFILEAGMQNYFPQLVFIPLIDSPRIIHGLVYQKRKLSKVGDFLRFIREQTGKEECLSLWKYCEKQKTEAEGL